MVEDANLYVCVVVVALGLLLCLIFRGSAAKMRWLEDMPPAAHLSHVHVLGHRIVPAAQNKALLSLMCLFKRLAREEPPASEKPRATDEAEFARPSIIQQLQETRIRPFHMTTSSSHTRFCCRNDKWYIG